MELDPADLTPHPKNREIYGDALDQSFVDRVERRELDQPVKVTSSSHFTDEADYTVISGHRRVKAAKSLDRDVPAEEVGPYETPEEEIAALLGFNDYRSKTPVQEIREVEQWAEVYRESPKSEIESAVEQAVEHASFSKATYYNGLRIRKAAQEGVWGQSEEDLSNRAIDEANRQWDMLEAGETTIGGAYKEVMQVRENQNRSPDLPEARGQFYPHEMAEEEISLDEPVQAKFWVSASKLRQFLKKAGPETGLREDTDPPDEEPDLYLQVGNGQVRAVTSERAGLQSTHSVSGDWFDEIPATEEGPYGISVVNSDLERSLDILQGDLRVEMRGPIGSNQATHLVMTNGQFQLCLVAQSPEGTPLEKAME